MTTEEFLEMFPECHIQTADDPKLGRDELVSCKLMKYHTLDGLHALNDKGAAIWFSPNVCVGSRSEANIRELKWAFVDLDIGTKEEMMAKIKTSPIKPTIITESKKSYHLYFRSNIQKENWRKVVRGIIQFFDGDEAVASMNEVLRLPGFNHMKNPEDPFPITVVSFDETKAVIPEEDLIKAFPYVSFTEQFKQQYGGDDVLEKLKNIPIRDVLSRLGVEVRGSQIFEEGRGTSAMVNVKENYVNRFSGKQGSGSTIDVVMYHKDLPDPAKAINWLKKEFHIADMPRTKKPPTPKSSFISYRDLAARAVRKMRATDASKLCRYHIPWLNEKLGAIFPSELIVVGADAGIGKSQFVIDLALHNAARGKRVLFYQLEMSNETVADRAMVRRIIDLSGEVLEPKDYHMNNLSPAQLATLDQALAAEQEIGENLTVYEGAFLDLEGFLESFEQQGPKSDIVMIDHLHYFTGSGENYSVELGNIMRAIKTLTNVSGVPIVVVSHLVKLEKGKEPELHHFYGSSNIGKESTTAIMLARDIEHNNTTIFVRKTRMQGGGLQHDFTWSPVLRTLVSCGVSSSDLGSIFKKRGNGL